MNRECRAKYKYIRKREQNIILLVPVPCAARRRISIVIAVAMLTLMYSAGSARTSASASKSASASMKRVALPCLSLYVGGGPHGSSAYCFNHHQHRAFHRRRRRSISILEGNKKYVPLMQRNQMRHRQERQMKRFTSKTNINTEINMDAEREKSNVDFIVNENNWKSHPLLSETYHIPTVLVSKNSIHTIAKELGPHYLVTRKKEFENVHPRLKAVQDPEVVGFGCQHNESSNDDLTFTLADKKLILLDPGSVTGEATINDANSEIENTFLGGSSDDGESRDGRINTLTNSFPKMSKSAIELLADASGVPGPISKQTIPYSQQPIQRILSKILPVEAQPPPTGYEQIGHVIHLNLKKKHFAHRKVIGSVILDRLSPKIQTVVNKVGEVGGPYRTYDMEILAGKPDTNVEVVEDGVSLQFDLRKVYWCTRLSGERSRLINDEFEEGQIIADAFCGVGALCVLAATKLGCTIYANDLNPDAAKFIKDSAKKNQKRFKAVNNNNDNISSRNMPSINVHCGDAFDFIQNLGSLPTLPNHVVMNYPLDSASFLGAFRWWPAGNNKDANLSHTTKVHLYTFARGDDPLSEDGQKFSDNPRSPIDVAIDLVAEGLLPEGGAIEKSRFRKVYLDKLGCDVQAHEVRDVAPGKAVICVSFKVSDLLLAVMQGDFIDID